MLETALLCLALNIYHESRGEPIAGQQAVALVTMNRAGGDPANVCSVVTKPKQFSWTNKLVSRDAGAVKLLRRGLPKENPAWQSALFTARIALRGKLADFTHGATHFHAKNVRPTWRHALDRVQVSGLGRHYFYR